MKSSERLLVIGSNPPSQTSGEQTVRRVKVPRRIAGRSMIPNQTSTRLSHDPDVG